MRKVCLAGVMAAAVALSACGKEEAEAPKPDKKARTEQQAVDLKEMTLTGTVQKVEKKKKDGTVMMSWFVLVDESGAEIHLPKGKADEFDGAKVKITGMGYVSKKKDKELPVLKTIEKIEKLEAAAAK